MSISRQTSRSWFSPASPTTCSQSFWSEAALGGAELGGQVRRGHIVGIFVLQRLDLFGDLVIAAGGIEIPELALVELGAAVGEEVLGRLPVRVQRLEAADLGGDAGGVGLRGVIAQRALVYGPGRRGAGPRRGGGGAGAGLLGSHRLEAGLGARRASWHCGGGAGRRHERRGRRLLARRGGSRGDVEIQRGRLRQRGAGGADQGGGDEKRRSQRHCGLLSLMARTLSNPRVAG
jgi:hypothetical protein